VTKVFFVELERRAQSLRVVLGNNAGIDATNDRFQSGYIQACQDIVNIDIEDIDNDN
jgi:hypothetical protein